MPVPPSFTTPQVVADMTAAASGTDYKALVCLFLLGGNDSHNTIIPRTGANRTAYDAARSTIGIAANATPLNDLNTEWRLHPALTELKSRWDAGDLCIFMNVGTLVAPIVKAQYASGGSLVPTQLFSHNNQQQQWQTTPHPTTLTTTGWMGRALDLAAPYFNATSTLPGTVSASGAVTQVSGYDSKGVVLGAAGAEVFDTPQEYGSTLLTGGYWTSAQTRAAYGNVVMTFFANQISAGVSSQNTTNSLLQTLPTSTQARFDAVPTNVLAQQLGVVCRYLHSRTQLNQRRQLAYVAYGTWDHHRDIPTEHNAQLTVLNEAVQVFWAALGDLGLQSQVCTFVQSDFGRTLLQNASSGADHGWGGHYFALCSAANKVMLGTPPSLTLGSDDDVGQGRLLPTTSLEQYLGTLLKWWGVPEQHLSLVLPNASAFTPTTLAGAFT